jgi:hypothetical protein
MKTRRDFLGDVSALIGGSVFVGGVSFGLWSEEAPNEDRVYSKDTIEYVEENGFVFPRKLYLSKMAKEFGIVTPRRFMYMVYEVMRLENSSRIKVFNSGLSSLVENNSMSVAVENLDCGYENSGEVFTSDEVADTLEEENIPYGQIIVGYEDLLGLDVLSETYSFISRDKMPVVRKFLERQFPERRNIVQAAAHAKSEREYQENCK